ncbi:hypothetical protein [Acinetobacter indicus]|uniref:hypothetical protein n=1 Tax=Acinetobacter indicus TaxID=756892 RepID=UPI00144424C3|nr:hypothetical protein [Acinetobacter indicus]
MKNHELILEAIAENSTLENATQFLNRDLKDLRDDLKAKRGGIITAKENASNGNAIAELNLELSKIKALLTKINQAIAMQDVNAKQQKVAEKQLKGGFAQLFLKVAERELDKATFNRIKNKALKVA